MSGAPGFTLVEVLVALTLAGSVALVVHLTVAVASDLSAATDGTDADVRRAAVVRRQLAAWLRETRSGSDSAGRAFRVTDHVAGGDPDDEVIMPVFRSGPLQPGTAVVRLWIDRDASTPESGLVAGVERPSGGRDSVTTVELVPGATGLDVEVLFTVSGRRQWFRGWNSLVQLPEAVRVHLSGDSVPELLRRPLPVALTGGA